MPYAYYTECKKKIEELKEAGLLTDSSSKYAAPVVCAIKKNGTIRMCGDYRAINAVTVPDRYTLPRVDYIKQHLDGVYFTILDLREGFTQVPVRRQDRVKTAISTPWGLFEYTRMPFGLRNCPPTFQRFMNFVTAGLDNIFVYIDDIIVFTRTLEEHERMLTALFDKLLSFGLVVNAKKWRRKIGSDSAETESGFSAVY